MILVLLGIIEDRIFYDLNVDGELIKGCHCRFHPFRHELEITRLENIIKQNNMEV